MQSVARQREQRLSMLGYELKVAKEDLKELRGLSGEAEEGQHEGQQAQQAQQGEGSSLAVASSSNAGAQPQLGADATCTQAGGQQQQGGGAAAAGTAEAGPSGKGPSAPGQLAAQPGVQHQGGLTSAERRQLIAAVRAFLGEQGLKLTAMTLAEVGWDTEAAMCEGCCIEAGGLLVEAGRSVLREWDAGSGRLGKRMRSCRFPCLDASELWSVPSGQAQ